jgi:hypothetical protein
MWNTVLMKEYAFSNGTWKVISAVFHGTRNCAVLIFTKIRMIEEDMCVCVCVCVCGSDTLVTKMVRRGLLLERAEWKREMQKKTGMCCAV